MASAGARQLSEKDRIERGLQHMGMLSDSGRSVLHLWSRQLPAGMFDGHRSAHIAPDNLLFHGLTKRLVVGVVRLLTVPQRRQVGVSLCEALSHSHYPGTTIYNPRSNNISGVSISDWATTLTVFPAVLRRTLACATSPRPEITTPWRRALRVVNAYREMVCAAYYYPRVDVNGVRACRERATPPELHLLAESFLDLVRAACLRADLAAFGFYLDVPNLHRVRELFDHVVPALLHVRHVQELLFEDAHQPLKRSVVTGNGHQDATRAMTRCIKMELVSRMRADPVAFSIPRTWLSLAGGHACLERAVPLVSQDGGAWRC